MSKKGIIFDMDGTLWDSSENVAKVWNEVANKAGTGVSFDITADKMKGVMGLTMDKLAERLFPGVSKEVQMQLLEKCGDEENAYLEKHGGRLYPKVEETLQKLKEKYNLYIVSNCQSGYIEAFLTFYGFGKYIDDIECYGNNNLIKGDNIRLVADRNHLDKAVYVGDIQGDYDSSVEAGVKFIHAAYGFGSIVQQVPVINEFSELPDVAENVFNSVGEIPHL